MSQHWHGLVKYEVSINSPLCPVCNADGHLEQSVHNARQLLEREFNAWVLEVGARAQHIPQGSGWWLGVFFDPRNQDEWMDAWIRRLQSVYQKPGRTASND